MFLLKASITRMSHIKHLKYVSSSQRKIIM
jgi:hypothetical protein